jgi:hypothetical protein
MFIMCYWKQETYVLNVLISEKKKIKTEEVVPVEQDIQPVPDATPQQDIPPAQNATPTEDLRPEQGVSPNDSAPGDVSVEEVPPEQEATLKLGLHLEDDVPPSGMFIMNSVHYRRKTSS